MGWQESARAGLGAEDIVQYWYTDIALPESLPPEVRAQKDANLAMSASYEWAVKNGLWYAYHYQGGVQTRTPVVLIAAAR